MDQQSDTSHLQKLSGYFKEITQQQRELIQKLIATYDGDLVDEVIEKCAREFNTFNVPRFCGFLSELHQRNKQYESPTHAWKEQRESSVRERELALGKETPERLNELERKVRERYGLRKDQTTTEGGRFLMYQLAKSEGL